MSRQNVTPYWIANSLTNCWQTVSLPVCELWAIAKLTERTHSHLGIGKWKKTEQTKGREGYGKTEFGQDAAISVEEEAIFVQSYKSRAGDFDLEHTLDARSPGDHCVQVWSQSSHLPARRSDFRASIKVPVSHDGLRTLTLSTHWMRAHLETIVCKFGCNRAICVILEAICVKNFTDGQTDGCRAIVLAHGMS